MKPPDHAEVKAALDVLERAGYPRHEVQNLSPAIRRFAGSALDRRATERYGGSLQQAVPSQVRAHPFLRNRVKQFAFTLLDQNGELDKTQPWNQGALIAALGEYVREHLPELGERSAANNRKAAGTIYSEWQRKDRT
jgi:hypothetical protein